MGKKNKGNKPQQPKQKQPVKGQNQAPPQTQHQQQSYPPQQQYQQQPPMYYPPPQYYDPNYPPPQYQQYPPQNYPPQYQQPQPQPQPYTSQDHSINPSQYSQPLQTQGGSIPQDVQIVKNKKKSSEVGDEEEDDEQENSEVQQQQNNQQSIDSAYPPPPPVQPPTQQQQVIYQTSAYPSSNYVPYQPQPNGGFQNDPLGYENQVQPQVQTQEQISMQQKKEEMLKNMQHQIEQLLDYLMHPSGSKPLYVTLKEAVEKINETLTVEFNTDTKGKTTCFTFVNNELYGQETGTSKKEARQLSSRQAALKLLCRSPEALKVFKVETEKEIEKRGSLPIQEKINVNDEIQEQIINTGDLSSFRAPAQPAYDPNVNYKQLLNDYAHKLLRTQITYINTQEKGDWIVIGKMSTITDRGVANNTKEAKNICAYRILDKIKELEGKDPLALKKNDKQSKRMAKKLQQKGIDPQTNNQNIEDRPHQEQHLVQKKVKTEQNSQSDITQLLDTKFINFNNFDNPFKQKQEEISLYLHEFVKQIAITEEQSTLCDQLYQEIKNQNQAFKQLGINSLIPVGSYQNKTLRADKAIIDLCATYYSEEQLTYNDLFQQQSILIKTLLDGVLAKAKPDESLERVHIDNTNQFILVQHMEQPQIQVHIYINFQTPQKPSYNQGIHNIIWFNKLGDLQDYPNIQNLMRVIRYLKSKYSWQIPIEILDFVLYHVSFKFRQANIANTFIDFINFLSSPQGLEQIVNSNCCSFEIAVFQSEMIKQAMNEQNRINIDQIISICKKVQQSGDYISLFNSYSNEQ